MIEVQGIFKQYGSVTACADISFSAYPGEVTALLGPNGAGKTTILKILSGALYPDSGEVVIQGFSMKDSPLEAKKNTGWIFENPMLYDEFTVTENLSFIAGMHGFQKIEVKNAVARVLQTCSLEGVSSRIIRGLSKGFKQRIGLAQALIHDPPVLILDEPTSGLDPVQLEEFRVLIRRIAKDKTILLSTHIMHEVELLCTRFLMLHKGHLIEQGTIADICRRTSARNIEGAFMVLASNEKGVER